MLDTQFMNYFCKEDLETALKEQNRTDQEQHVSSIVIKHFLCMKLFS